MCWRSQGRVGIGHVEKQIIESWLLISEVQLSLSSSVAEVAINFNFFKKKNNMTGISYQHTQQDCLRINTSNLLSFSRAEPTTTSTFFIVIRTMFLFTILGGGGGTAWKCDMRLSNFCGETRDESAVGLEASSSTTISQLHNCFWYVSYRECQLSFDWYRYPSNSNRNPKNDILEGRAIGDNPRKEVQVPEEQNLLQIDTRIGLSKARPGLISFRGRLGVAPCKANKESVCVFVYLERA